MPFMNTAHVYSISTESPEATSRLGVRLGRLLKGGEVIELSSDLGGGKTVLAKAIAAGLGYTSEVVSPTFSVSKAYQLPNGLELDHFDFYRIGSGDVVATELAETVGQPGIITIIEWAEAAGTAVPADRLKVTITPTGESTRELTFESLGPKHHQLLESLQS